jgi:hypothetical protein
VGRVAKVISTERDADGALNVRVDPGGGAGTSVPHFGDVGDDSVPLPGDYAAIEDSAGAGAEQVTGYHDPRNAGVGLPGEVKKNARNDDGEIVGYVWLQKTGDIEIRALNGARIRFVTDGPVELVSPNVLISDAAGAGLARVGDLIAGTVHALSASPGAPIVPGPPVPGGGVPFVGQIISGSTKAKA